MLSARGTGATIVLLAASWVTAGTATAEASVPNCQSRDMCVYQGTHYAGAKLSFNGGVPRGICQALSTRVNSAANNSPLDQYLYADSQCAGVRIRLCAEGTACPGTVPDIARLLGRGAASVSG